VLPRRRLGQALVVLVLNKWFEIEQIVGELRIRLGERATNWPGPRPLWPRSVFLRFDRRMWLAPRVRANAHSMG